MASQYCKRATTATPECRRHQVIAARSRYWSVALACARSITVLFSTSTICTYAGFAWLPKILGDVVGSITTEAGVLLAVTGLVGVPGSLLPPLLTVRLRNVGWLIFAGVSTFLSGYLGLLLAPATLPLLWVLLIGSGSILFPISLVLINSRTRTRVAPSRSAGSPRAWVMRSVRSVRCSLAYYTTRATDGPCHCCSCSLSP